MISSIKEITHLRGLDFGEKLEPRDKIRATASRVGLAVPRVSRFMQAQLLKILLHPPFLRVFQFADDEFAVPLDAVESKDEQKEKKEYVLPIIADETVVKNSS